MTNLRRRKIPYLAFALGLTISCGTIRWTAYVYPNAPDLSVVEEIEGFQSEDDCIAAAEDHLSSIGRGETGDYECVKE